VKSSIFCLNDSVRGCCDLQKGLVR
jgi:hypothetical protein